MTVDRCSLLETPGETIGWLLLCSEELACSGGGAGAKPSVLDLKFEAIPGLWPERVSQDGTSLVVHDPVGRSVVGFTLTVKGAA